MVMPADTAEAPSLDTAPTEPTTPETQLGAGTEATTEPTLGTETASTEGETETVDPLAEYDAAKVRELPSVKALLEATTRDVEARQAESYRQKAQAAEEAASRKANAEAYQRNQAEVQAVDQGSAMSALYQALEATVNKSIDPDARERLNAEIPKLREMAQTLTRSTQTRLDNAALVATNEYLRDNFEDYRIAPEVVAKFDAALTRGDFKARHAILLDIVKEAAVAAATPKVKADAVRELKAEAEKTLALQKQQASEKASTANGRPTAVAGRPAMVGNYRTRLEVATAHVAGQLSNEQARAYYSLPLSQLPEA